MASQRSWCVFGVLADALTAADDVIERDVHQAPVQVDVADLQAAQLTAAHAGNQPSRGYSPRAVLLARAPAITLGTSSGEVAQDGLAGDGGDLPG